MVCRQIITFVVNIANESNVIIKYRTLLSVKDSGLFEALKVSVGGRTAGNASDWTVMTDAGEIASEECSIELPASATDEYQGKSCKIDFVVEAVQGNVDESTVNNGDVYDEKQLRLALYEAPADGTKKVIRLKSDVTLQMLYAAENFGTETIADNEEGDTFNRYKLGVHPLESDPNHWNPLVTDQTQEERIVYGAYYHVGATDERIGRLVVKNGQNVIIDLNGYTIRKASRASHGDWSNTCTDIIANYGTLTLTDSSANAGTVMGNGYISCGGAVVHNYEGATCTIEKINVDGNAAGMAAHTGQYVLVNEGTMIVESANVYDDATSASLLVSTKGLMTVKGNTVLNHPYSKNINCKGGEIVVEDGVKMVSDKYAVYAKAGTVTVKDGVVIEGEGILYEDGGTIICNQYPVQTKQVQPATSKDLYEALENGSATITVEEGKEMVLNGKTDEAGNIDEYVEAKLKNAGKVNLILNGTLTSGKLNSTWGCMRVMEGTTLTIAAGENGKFVNNTAWSNININGGEVVVNGGYFESAGVCFFFYMDIDNEKMSLTINDGEFKAGEDGVIDITPGMKVTVIINGGTFYNWDPSAYVNSETHEVIETTVEGEIIYTVTAK